jgi:orotate phosphoribosyltransferase
MTLRRGFRLGEAEPLVVVEDVITTGGSTREVIEAVRARGSQVLAVGSLVDRSGGTVDFGVPRRSLLELEVPTYSPEACPLCASGSTPEKPGSRAAATR